VSAFTDRARYTKSSEHLVDHQFIFYMDTANHTLSCGTSNQINGKSVSGLLSFPRGDFKVALYPDFRNFQDSVHILDLSLHIGPKSLFGSGDLFSGQHRGQCSHHSTRSCRHNMVEGGRVFFLRLDFIEALYPPVDSVIDGFVETLDHSSAGRSYFPNNPDSRCVNYFSHDTLLCFYSAETKARSSVPFL